MFEVRILIGGGLAFLIGFGAPLVVETAQPLGIQRHEKAGLACGACHGENPPQNTVPTARCVQCHGEYTALARKTEKVVPNPHAPTPHSGPTDMPECDSCHHIHKPSQDSCLQCHETFNFRTP